MSGEQKRAQRREKVVVGRLVSAVVSNELVRRRLRDCGFTPEQIMKIPVKDRKAVLNWAESMMPKYYETYTNGRCKFRYLNTERWAMVLEEAVTCATQEEEED